MNNATNGRGSSSFIKVKDGRKHPIRGLWQRNGLFYAQITQVDSITGEKAVRRVRLESSTTVAQAVLEMQAKQAQRRGGGAVAMRRAPEFGVFADEYLERHTAGKQPTTLAVEKVVIRKLKERLGSLTLDKITPATVNRWMSYRSAEGVGGRTLNLNMTILRNVLKCGQGLGHITSLPTDGIKPVKHKAKRKGLLTSGDIEAVCAAALHYSSNGEQFVDYIRFLTYSGARSTEALNVQWDHVHFDRKQLAFHETKNGSVRDVDFNPKLEALLLDMSNRRLPDSPWLFPSCRMDGVHASTFRETLRIARVKAGCPQFGGFHLLRHYFISQCVMTGLDYMTIAKWVGHKDGGMLIGKVYGHLNNAHTLSQAQRLTSL